MHFFSFFIALFIAFFSFFSLFLVFFLSLSVGVDLQFKNSREAASRQSSHVVVKGNFVPNLTPILRIAILIRVSSEICFPAAKFEFR